MTGQKTLDERTDHAIRLAVPELVNALRRAVAMWIDARPSVAAELHDVT